MLRVTKAVNARDIATATEAGFQMCRRGTGCSICSNIVYVLGRKPALEGKVAEVGKGKCPYKVGDNVYFIFERNTAAQVVIKHIEYSNTFVNGVGIRFTDRGLGQLYDMCWFYPNPETTRDAYELLKSSDDFPNDPKVFDLITKGLRENLQSVIGHIAPYETGDVAWQVRHTGVEKVDIESRDTNRRYLSGFGYIHSNPHPKTHKESFFKQSDALFLMPTEQMALREFERISGTEHPEFEWPFKNVEPNPTKALNRLRPICLDTRLEILMKEYVEHKDSPAASNVLPSWAQEILDDVLDDEDDDYDPDDDDDMDG
jgi:hypothetical protein